MPSVTWLNGVFVSGEAAKASVFDAGLQHGIGLFETMLATNTRPLHLHEHLGRLQRSARELGLSTSLHINPLAEAVRRAVEKAVEPRARVRLTITGGDMGAALAPTGPSGGGAPPRDPTILITVQPAAEYPAEMFARGVTVAISDARLSNLDPLAGHKTLAYWGRLRELQIAGAKGAAETLLFDTSNRLLSGAVSNVFLVQRDVLRTPPARGERGEMDSPLPATLGEEAAMSAQAPAPRATLPGITRAAVIDFADALEIPVERGPLTIDDLLGAEEVFLTNSSWGVLPVSRVEGHAVGSARRGPITEALRAKWLEAVQEESDT